MEAMVRRGVAAGVALGLLAAGTAQAQQTFPPDTKLLAHVDGVTTVQTVAGTFTGVLVSPKEGTRIVVPRWAWGRKVGEIRTNTAPAVPLRLPAGPGGGAIVLRAAAPRVVLVPSPRGHDLRITRFAAPTSLVEVSFTGPKLLRLTCPGTITWDVKVTRTNEAPVTVPSGGACG